MIKRVVLFAAIYAASLIYLWFNSTHGEFMAYIIGALFGMVTLRHMRWVFAARKSR